MINVPNKYVFNNISKYQDRIYCVIMFVLLPVF